jgi:hypothetical protein
MNQPGCRGPANQKETVLVTNVRIIQARDCVRATPDGTLDRAAGERGLAEVAAASRGLTNFEVLLDLRRAQVTLTIADAWSLAYHLVGLPEMRRHKIAVVPPADDFDRAAFFALVAGNRGLWVRAFASFEEAIDWLAEDRTGLSQ